MAFTKKDMLEAKNRELAKCRRQFDDAIEIVHSTIARLEFVYDRVTQKIQEIDDYEAQLQETRAGLVENKDKTDRVIQNFMALLGE